MSLESYKAAKEKINALLEEARTTAQEAFQEGANCIFEKFPGLESFRWAQYTPYFNDGDTCEFYAQTDYFEIQFEGEDFESGYGLKPEIKPVEEAISELLGVFEDRDYLAMFDDHVRVTVTRHGVNTEGYNHD